MVKKALSFLNIELNSINEAALLLGAFTFLSQILGLVRDRLLASFVGAGTTLDIYYASFRIPDFLYVSLASLASITVLMPFLAKLLTKENGKEQARIFMSNVFSVFIILMICISILVYILMPWIAKIVAPGFTDDSLKILVSTSRIMLLSPIIIGISNMFGTITQLYKKFFIFSLSPVFYNFGIILGILFFYPIFGTSGLAYGVILGAIFHLAIQIPTIIKAGFMPHFLIKINWKEIYEVVRISLPRILTMSSGSVAFIVLISIASQLIPGSISLFTFSFNLQSVPVGIIGISYSVAAFPVLVRSFAIGDIETFKRNVVTGIKQIIFWSFPVIALFIILRAQIVRVLLGVSTFSWDQTRLTAAAVGLFLISLASQAIVLLLVRAYYAAGNTKKPLITSLFSSLSVILFGYFFILIFKNFPNLKNIVEFIMRVENVNGTEMLALPIAFVLGSIINVFLLWNLFKKEFFQGLSSGIFRIIFEIGLASIVIGLVTYISLSIFDDIFILETFKGIFLQGFCSGIFGIISGIIILKILKNKEYFSVVNALSKKFWHKNISIPEQHQL